MSLQPQRIVLDNGIAVLYHPMPANPFVAFHGCLWAGAASEDKRGVAEFTARLLLGGTKTRKSSKLAEDIERLGATLEFRNAEEAVHFGGKCPRETAPKVFGIMVDCLSNPSFPQSEVEKEHGEILDEIKMDMDDTARRAAKELMASLYPNHLYGKDPRGEVTDVKRIKRSDLVSHHKASYGPKGMIVVMSGDVDRELVEKKISPVLSKFEGEGERPKLPIPAPAKKVTKTVPMPHKTQADIAVGLRAIPRNHKDFHALNMANLLFGRIGMYGRLGKNLRDTQGLAYYSFSTLDPRLVAGHWAIAMGVNPENLQKAVDGIRLEMDRLHKEPLTDQEISDGKDNQIGSLKVSLERNVEMAGEMFRMEYFGLGLDYLKRFPEMIRSLTVEQIHEAAEKYIRIEDCSLAVAGPVGRYQEKKLQLS